MTSIPGAAGANGARTGGQAAARGPRGRVPVLRVAVLAAALGMLSACSGSASPASGQAPPAQTRAAAASARLMAESLDFAVPATGAEFTTGAQFISKVFWLRDQLRSVCMARSGFHVPVTPAGAYASDFAGSTQFPDLARITRMGNFGPVTPLQPPTVRILPSQRHAFSADMNRCRAAAGRPVTAFAHASVPLTESWMSSVLSLRDSAKVRQAWIGATSCLEQAGIPAADAGSFEAFFAYEGSLGIKADATKASVLRVDEHWAPIFVRCAAPVVEIEEPLQSAQRALFIQHHHQQVRQLRTVADQIIAQYRHAVTAGGRG